MNKQYIQLEERDIDGYWIYLKDGWQDRHNPGCHTIVENTKRQAHQHRVIPCDCQQCRNKESAGIRP